MADWKALDAYLDGWAAKDHIAGYSAYILGPDGPVYTHSSGITNAEGTKHPDENTIFGIASMSKSITALCACILETEGRLRLDDPVTDYLPSFRMPGQPRDAVTIRHLCSHTTGMPPMEVLEWSSAMNSRGRRFGEEGEALRASAPNAMDTIEEVIDYVAHCPHAPIGAPGERYSYSNESFAILSYVIDKAAGMPLEQFMQERVFAPCGMTRSLLDNGFQQSRELAAGNFTSLFTWEDGKQNCDDGWTILPPFRGCAMVKSTSHDMAAYYRMLSNYGVHDGKQVVPHEAVEALLGAAHPLSPIPQMCLGINKRSRPGHIICDHGGGLHGVSTKGALLLGEGYGFALLSNESEADLDAAMWAMENAVTGRPLDESHEWFHASGREFSAPEMLVGVYHGFEGLEDRVTVSAEGGLHAEKKGQRYPLVHCGETRFLAMTDGAVFAHLVFFIRDGKAWGVRYGTRVYTRAEENA